MNGYSILLAKTISSEEKTDMQAPKQDTHGISNSSEYSSSGPNSEEDNDDDDDKPNRDNTRTWDVTAEKETSSSKRARSHHSSFNQGTKDGSVKVSTSKHQILVNNHRVVSEKLVNYLNDGKYNGIIRLIDDQFLKYCYSLIKNNPGDIVKGTVPTILRGISDK
jgi:hypothetical protein